MTNCTKRGSAQVAALVVAVTLIAGGKAAADFVINDDLIVIGSTCVGFDCVDGESFGSDTIRLKENQLRIHFMDTSVGTFPSNDWRLMANDTASGGSNFFAIEDSTAVRQVFKVEAGAAANSLFIDSTSRVGLRTSTPVLDLHINTSNTPAHRLEQNNSGGFTAQTWDVAGNETNFFVRDVTGGSRLPFRIRPGAPTSSIDISADGDVGIGTASPGLNGAAAQNILTVFGGPTRGMLELVSNQADAAGNTAGQVGYFANNNTGPNGKQVAAIVSNTAGATANDRGGNLIIFTKPNAGAIVERARVDENGNVGINTATPTQRLDVNGSVRVGTLLANPAANTMCFSATNVLGNCTSDRRLKRDVEYLAGSAGLGAVMALKPAAFRWHDGDDRVMAGFVAQDTRGAIPAAVHQPAGTEFLALDTGAVLAYAVKAIQELKTDNDTLRAEVERLKVAR